MQKATYRQKNPPLRSIPRRGVFLYIQQISTINGIILSYNVDN